MRAKDRESGRFRVVVVQHGETDTEYFDDFETLRGQFYNYGLTSCFVDSYEDTEGEFTQEQEEQLHAALREGWSHWSHRE